MKKHHDFNQYSFERMSFDRPRFEIIKARGMSFLLLIFLCCIGESAVNAQTDTTSEVKPSAATAETTPEATPAPAPAPKATPLGGTVEGSENTHIESKIQSYRSVTEITRNIADDIYQFNPNAKTFILYRDADYKTWQNYRLNKNRLETQMTTLGCNYEVWISLAAAAFEKLPPEENPPPRNIWKGVSKDCKPVKEVVETAPEVKAFEQVITYQDDFLKKYPDTQKQIADLDNRVSRVESQMQSAKPPLIRRGGINSIVTENLILENFTIAKNTSATTSEKKNDGRTNVEVFTSALGVVGGFVSPVTTLVGTAIDLIGFFRSDLKFSSSTVAIKDSVARSNIANSLRIRYCNKDKFPATITSEEKSENQSEEQSERRTESLVERLAERREAVQLAARTSPVIPSDSACEVVVYDPLLFTPDVVYDGKFSNGNDKKKDATLPNDNDKKKATTLPDGIQWMKDLNEQREKARVAIASYDYLTAKNKAYDTQIAAYRTSIAADETLVKEYTALLVTLIEKTKDNKNDLTPTASREITALISKARDAQEAKLTEIKKLEKERKPYEMPKHLEFVVENLKAINTAFDKFNEVFTKMNDTSGLSPQMIYERAARLDAMFGDSQASNKAYWLDINALEMEGNTRVRKNLFRYFYYPDISHNGGSIVQYALSDPSGRVLLANTEDRLMKYRKSSNVGKPQ